MKRYLISLIASGSVCVMFTSALVVPRAPAKPQATVPDQKSTTIKTEVKVERKADLPIGKPTMKALFVQKAIAVGPAANLERMVEQNIRQGRPTVRAELIFARKVCALNIEQLRRINHDFEKALKDAATKWAENQQQPRMRIVAKGANAPNAQTVDGFKALQEELLLVLKKNLTPEQFARYEIELGKRNANRRQSALHYLVDAMDRDLFLTDQQRARLAESLAAHWDESWCTSLEYVLYGNQFYPVGIDPFVMPFLDDTQKRVWQGTQKVGGIWGFGGVLGNFMNDNDALEEELGGAQKIEAAHDAAIPKQMPFRVIETKKAVAKDAPRR